MTDHERADALSPVLQSTIDQTDVGMQAVIDTAQDAIEPHLLDPGTLALVHVPAGGSAAVIDLERKLPKPRRKRGEARLHTAPALAVYVQNHQEGDATTLYGDLDALTVTALLNGHHAIPEGDPGWGDHRAILTLRRTPEWQAWVDLDGQSIDQQPFAEFIEDHVADIVEPTGADMLELAKTFEAKSNVDFSSAIRLDSGQRRLTYIETIAARAGAEGRMEVPETIKLGLRPFDGCEPYRLNARLRFRIVASSLKIGVVLDRPDLVLRSAFDDVLAMLADETGYAALRGTPPA